MIFRRRRAHEMLRTPILPGDADTASETLWSAWFFEAAPASLDLTAAAGAASAAGGTAALSVTLVAAAGGATAPGGVASLRETLVASNAGASGAGGSVALTVVLLAAAGAGTGGGGTVALVNDPLNLTAAGGDATDPGIGDADLQIGQINLTAGGGAAAAGLTYWEDAFAGSDVLPFFNEPPAGFYSVAGGELTVDAGAMVQRYEVADANSREHIVQVVTWPTALAASDGPWLLGGGEARVYLRSPDAGTTLDVTVLAADETTLLSASYTPSSMAWVKVRLDGTNITVFTGPDGVSWTTVATVAYSSADWTAITVLNLSASALDAGVYGYAAERLLTTSSTAGLAFTLLAAAGGATGSGGTSTASSTSGLSAGAGGATAGGGTAGLAFTLLASQGGATAGGGTVSLLVVPFPVDTATHGLTPRSRRSRGARAGSGIELVQARDPFKDEASAPATTVWKGLRGSLSISPFAAPEPWLPNAALPAFAVPKREPQEIPGIPEIPVRPLPTLPFEIEGVPGEWSTDGVEAELELVVRAGPPAPIVGIAGIGGELWLMPGAHRDEEELPPQVLEMLFS